MKRAPNSIITSFTVSRTYPPTLSLSLFYLPEYVLPPPFSLSLGIFFSLSRHLPTLRFKNLQATPFLLSLSFPRRTSAAATPAREASGSRGKGGRRSQAGGRRGEEGAEKGSAAAGTILVNEEKIKVATRTDHPSPLGAELTQHYVLLTALRT